MKTDFPRGHARRHHFLMLDPSLSIYFPSALGILYEDLLNGH